MISEVEADIKHQAFSIELNYLKFLTFQEPIHYIK